MIFMRFILAFMLAFTLLFATHVSSASDVATTKQAVTCIDVGTIEMCVLNTTTLEVVSYNLLNNKEVMPATFAKIECAEVLERIRLCNPSCYSITSYQSNSKSKLIKLNTNWQNSKVRQQSLAINLIV